MTTIDSLTCEGRNAPLGIGTGTPCYGWRFSSDEKGVRQTAYRILVSSSGESLASDAGDLWDSGWVNSPTQFTVEHAGPPLPEKTPCWWKVMARVTVPGNVTLEISSAPATFETGIFKRDSWLGWWASGAGKPVYLRREFEIPSEKPVIRARAYIGATGDKANTYELWINGQRVGDDIISPGQTSPKRARYQTHDVAGLLQAGANAVAIIHTSSLMFQLEIGFDDGSCQAVFPGKGWRQRQDGPFVTLRSDGKGETYDAQLEPAGWERPGFDDSTWAEFAFAAPWNLTKDLGPRFLDAQQDRVVALDTFAPRSLQRGADGSYILDFGQNQHGVIRFRVKGEAGRRIVLRYGERLHADGALDPRSLGAPEQDEYILRGGGEETYQPHFATHAFRYVEVKGWPGKLRPEQIEARTVHSDMLAASAFSCSNERLNRLHRAALWAFRSNLVSVPTDCPGRERKGWTGDAHCHSEADCLNFRMGNFYDKWLTDIADFQGADGAIPWVAPDTGAWNGVVDVPFMSAMVLVPWDYYEASGDVAFLRRHYPAMRLWIDSLHGDRDGNHLLQHDVIWGDWCNHAPNRQPETGAFLATVFYYQCLSRLQKIAAVLNEPGDAARFAQQAQSSAEGLNRVFLRADGGYDVGSQAANALALVSGFVPEQARAGTLRCLVDDIEHHGAMRCGCFGAKVILDVLGDHGRNDLALRLIGSTREGNWGHWLTLGATTAVEGFYGLIVNSQNHAFLAGGLDAWFYRHLAGIQIMEPGYSKVRIRPWVTAPLSNVKAQVETAKGLVVSEWRRENGRLVMKVNIPANAEAEIHLPTAEASTIEEEGKPLLATSRAVRVSDGWTVVQVGSGEYEFGIVPAPPQHHDAEEEDRALLHRSDGQRESFPGPKFSLPDEWHIFGPIERGDPLSTDLLKAVPASFEVRGVSVVPRKVEAEDGRLDMAPYIGGTANGHSALVYVPFHIAVERVITLNVGADYWFEAFLDGQRLHSTIEPAHAIAPALIREHTVCTTLAVEKAVKKGNHLLAVRFVSGSGGSVLCLGGC
ncbi:MAG: family 78 glycoside hydrolase catalytic domain [Verrucomicrobiae bacterium]